MSDNFRDSKHDSDVEKDYASSHGSTESDLSLPRGFRWGVEARGSSDLSSFPAISHIPPIGTVPVRDEDRNDTQFYKIFFVWFSINFNILSSVALSAYDPSSLTFHQVFSGNTRTGRVRPWSPRFLSCNLIL